MLYNQQCDSTIRDNTKSKTTHTLLIRSFKRSPALESINTIQILSMESVSHQSVMINYWKAVQRCDYIVSLTEFLFH